MEAQARTTEELNKLKENWLKDPCWDIETTAGFEAHVDELKGFRLKVEGLEKARREEQAARRRIQTIITRIYENGARYVADADDAISKLMKEGWAVANISVVQFVDNSGDWPVVVIERVTTLTRTSLDG